MEETGIPRLYRVVDEAFHVQVTHVMITAYLISL